MNGMDGKPNYNKQALKKNPAQTIFTFYLLKEHLF